MEPKKVDIKIEDGKLVVHVDLNQDGEHLLELKIDLKELPQEAWELWKELKEKK